MECVVGNWIRCWEEKNIAAAKEAVGADIKAHMEEVVSVFLYANRMRRSVLVDIVSATTVYQAAPFLKAWPNSSLASKTRTSSMSSNSARFDRSEFHVKQGKFLEYYFGTLRERSHHLPHHFRSSISAL
ncbi:hypothetical protein VIGAN_02225400 [Vigna angularis var. angularis]|uniref:Uncharacterized protein n=1 Tax=Vigna angularis var. angularis TaxID=157739 RepID=A0A0S3RFG1_PHAAN|nr:hypothetical protein VIGAN_02225400 [Vigna angularis var. angularis]